jgi:signal transduction histidine kinase
MPDRSLWRRALQWAAEPDGNGRYVLGAIVSLALVAAVLATAAGRRAGHALDDLALSLTAPAADYRGLVVVDVDEASLHALASQLGAWPYDRRVFALLQDHLRSAGAERVVYDIQFSDPRPGDTEFAAALAKGPPSFLAASASSIRLRSEIATGERVAVPVPVVAWPSLLLPVAPLAAAAEVGVITVLPDDDGILRRVSLAQRDAELELLTLPWALAAADGAAVPPLDGTDAVLHLADRDTPLPVVPFYRVLLGALGEPQAGVPAEVFQGRTVFVGSTAALLGDYVYLAGHERVPGLHALAMSYRALSAGEVLVVAGPWVAWSLALAVVALLALAWQASTRTFLPYMLASAGVAAVLLILPVVTVASLRVALDVTPALAFVVLNLVPAAWNRIARLQDQRRRLSLERDAAAQAAELKARFLAHMSHELRTPLTAIIGHNRLLSGGVVAPDKVPDTLRTVDRNAQRLLKLINDALDHSKLEAGQMQLDDKPTGIPALLEEVRDLLAPLAAQKGLQLTVETEASVPSAVLVDGFRLRQIVENLTGNALKFTDGGKVHIKARWSEERLVIRVTDSGHGVPADAAARLFEAFAQGNAGVAARHGGTGLGLAISQGLAQLMGGGLRLAANTAHGASFEVEIAAPAVDVTSIPPIAVPSEAPLLPSLKVLLVDDNADLRSLVRGYLIRDGHAVEVASDGREALRLARALEPDLVIMDLVLPHLDGLAATRQLRAKGFTAPIIAISAEREEAEARAAGCDAFLAKPIAPNALRRAMSACFRREA